jgi:hypothetical protein
MLKRLQLLCLVSISCLTLTYLSLTPTATPPRSSLSPETLALFHTHALNNTLIIIPTNTGHLPWTQNLLCSLTRAHFNTSTLIFWALDAAVHTTLATHGHATYHNPALFASAANENAHGDTRAYKRMMRERPTFYRDVLSAGFDILMLDADTVFWQSPLSIRPTPTDDDDDVDIVYSTDAREFYTPAHSAFEDPRRRGPYVPPICNGIFWMRSNARTVALWSEMWDVFNTPWWRAPFVRRRGFLDDQRGMDVLLNDGRAQLVGPFPDGIREEMVPKAPGRGYPPLKVRILDQTQVVNGHLLLNRRKEYEERLGRLRERGEERIAAHFNWWTVETSKEEGVRELGLYFVDEEGRCRDEPGR